MVKALFAAALVMGMSGTALALEMPDQDLVPAEALQNPDTSTLVHEFVVCYARDRYGYLYSASHPQAWKAQEKALRECERASRSRCWEAGCRYPDDSDDPRPYPHRRGD